jgi:starch synthase (maltosyl-transferring)
LTGIQATTTRVIIEDITPQIDCGRFPAKRIVGDEVIVEADVFTDGHDRVAADVEWSRPGDGRWLTAPMQQIGGDRCRGSFRVDALGRHRFRVRGWVDHFETWRRGLDAKTRAGQDVSVELEAGAEMVEQAADRAEDPNPADAVALRRYAQLLGDEFPAERRIETSGNVGLVELMHLWGDRTSAEVSPQLMVHVDREKARFSSWYELFPRSWGEPGEHGTLTDVADRLDYVAAMGFDVVYLPPIHPIGATKRKGPNNTLDAGPDDPGVPWAVGSEDGGHTAINPQLGTVEDFRTLRHRAESLGIELALDIAFQCSPDHPWVDEHPEWFRHRPDGSIQYAENPPKRYEDIYPLDFETSDPEGLWMALRDVFAHWIDEGVRIFRVDNPHTKAFRFWEWVIDDLGNRHPDVIFLAEAFTRPAVMHRLAKLGFTQSYTYFTWRNTRWEIESYMRDLARTADFLRPNFWPNTPDILPEYLQTGGRAAFVVRAVLAATLSSNYGVYGPEFELMGSVPRSQGSEEYLDSEKYQIRAWDLDRPDSLAPLLERLNRARRDHPALQRTDGVTFHDTDNPEIICFSKQHGDDVVVVVANVDPHHVQSGYIDLPRTVLGVDEHRRFQMHDLLIDRRFLWSSDRNYVELDPAGVPVHVFAVRRLVRTEHDFDYYL